MYRVESAGIVNSIEAWLQDDDTIEVERALQFEKFVDQSLRGRINAILRVWKPSRIEHVHVAIASTARNVEVDGRPCCFGRRDAIDRAQREQRYTGYAELMEHSPSGKHGYSLISRSIFET